MPRNYLSISGARAQAEQDSQALETGQVRNALLRQQIDQERQVFAQQQRQFDDQTRMANTEWLANAAEQATQNPAAWPSIRQEGIARGMFNDGAPQQIGPNELAVIAKSARAALGGNQTTQDPVQSAFTTPEGNLGYLTRSGKPVVTGQQVAGPAMRPIDVAGGKVAFDPRTGAASPISSPQQEDVAAANRTAAVEAARVQVQQSAEAAASARSADDAFAAFDVALTGLSDALANTFTAPGVSMTPAMTASAQIADGARAAMAPILKSIFRVAGEGVFTDRDQALLLDMLPSRSTLPEARDVQIKAVRDIVRAKLMGAGALAPPTQQAGPVQISSDDEFDALPSGTQFVGPDGVPRVKP